MAHLDYMHVFLIIYLHVKESWNPFFLLRAVNECISLLKSFCSLSDNYSSFIFFHPLPHPSLHPNLQSMKKIPKSNQQENNKKTCKTKTQNKEIKTTQISKMTIFLVLIPFFSRASNTSLETKATQHYWWVRLSFWFRNMPKVCHSKKWTKSQISMETNNLENSYLED